MSGFDPRVWIAAALAIFLAFGGGCLKGRSTGRAQERADQQQIMLGAVEAARTEEQRRIAAQSGIANAAKKKAEDARADASAARTAADGLRQQAATVARRDTGCAATAIGGPPAFDAAGMLADVLSRIDERAGVLAEYADAARIAGQACERSYDTLTTP